MFRFTIRELLLLTVIAAIGSAWWLDHRNQREIDQRREFAEWQRDRLAMLTEALGHKVTLYNQWKVDVDDDSIYGEYDENLREVPWHKNGVNTTSSSAPPESAP